jgi:hypothetical protein
MSTIHFIEWYNVLWICSGMYRCLKFIAICFMVVSRMCKSLYILSVHEDDKIIFILGFLYRKLLSVSKLWGFHYVFLKVCLVMYLFWRELEIGGKSKILMVCLWRGFFEFFLCFKNLRPTLQKRLHKKWFSKLHKCLSFWLWSLLLFFFPYLSVYPSIMRVCFYFWSLSIF